MPSCRTAVDPRMTAVLSDLEPLRYQDGGAAADDRPGHVRAASAVRRVGGRLVIVQDDVNVIALHGASTRAVLLPAGPGGRRVFDDVRGNKADKLDLEAAVVLPDGRLVAFGSGSTTVRETLVIFDGQQVRTVDGAALYAGLRACTAFAGSELNVEGAAVVDGDLWLAQRGNGALVDGREPVNALGRIDLAAFVAWLDAVPNANVAPPALTDVTPFDLGDHAGVPYTFTDIAALGDGRIALLACAEASPDTVRDGVVVGARFGLWTVGAATLRVTDIVDPHGRPVRLKLEGLERRLGPGLVFDVVADVDDPAAPALLGTLTVTGA